MMGYGVMAAHQILILTVSVQIRLSPFTNLLAGYELVSLQLAMLKSRFFSLETSEKYNGICYKSRH